MIANNLKQIKKQIEETVRKVHRSTDEIKLVAVSKRFPVEKITEAYAAGQIFFGEN